MNKESEQYWQISPVDAWTMMQENPSVTLIDVRSDMEFLMIGHPKGAVNVPLIDEPEWTVDEAFVVNVRKALLGRVAARDRTSPPLLLICRSGNRSRDAALILTQEGLTEVYVVSDGFEGPLDNDHHRNTVAGWRFEGLPWEQC
ncbi:MAG: rhodanese-like domain-containing protein [Granulosicoccus sp.]